MANSNNNVTNIAYSGTATTTTPKSLNTGSRFDFDYVAINADADAAAIYVSADNQGTPTTGDYLDLWIKWSVDGTNYDTDEHAMPLGRLDTVSANTPGEDPAARTFSIEVAGKQRFKLSAQAPAGASRTINVVAVYNEHRAA